MDIEREIKKIEEELKKTPYNKATERHIGKLKAKLARFKSEAEKQRQKTAKHSFSIRKGGDATVVMVGFPSVGKSTILNKLTNARSEVAEYDFTTLKPTPGMLIYKGARIQLIDTPGLIEGAARGKGRGREILNVARIADLILVVVDVFTVDAIDIIKSELFSSGIRLDSKPPKVVIKKSGMGGIKVNSPISLSLSEETIIGILKEFRIHNAEVTILEDLTIDRLIDALSANRVYIPSLTVINKVDIFEPSANATNGAIKISAKYNINLEKLKMEIYNKLKFIRVYLKPPGNKVEFSKPLILREGSRILDVCQKVHKDFINKFKYAKVWGKSVKFNGQRVGLDHILKDGDIVTIYT